MIRVRRPKLPTDIFCLKNKWCRVQTIWLHSRGCARLLCSRRKNFATVETWNFGLCATRSREPRQARKGATVPGTPLVPQITRSSSFQDFAGEVERVVPATGVHPANELPSYSPQVAPTKIWRSSWTRARHRNARECH